MLSATKHLPPPTVFADPSHAFRMTIFPFVFLQRLKHMT